MALRTPLRRLALWTCAAFAGLLGGADVLAQAGPRDMIVVIDRDGTERPQRDVAVVGETLDLVRYQRGGAERNYRTATVARIEFGPGSTAFEQGLRAAGSRDWVNAETLFGTASRDTAPPWVAAHALLRQAEAAAARGATRLDAARAAVEEFLARFADHRLLPQALLLKARLASRAADRTTADGAIEQLLQLAKTGRVTSDWQVRAHLALGDMRLDGDDARGAATAYEAAGSAADAARAGLAERPDLQQELAALLLAARVGVASTLLAANDVAGARAFYQRLAADAGGDPAVAAAAANGLAECDFRAGNLYKEAQAAFARVAVDAGGVPSERARALYFLGRCAEELERTGLEPNGRQKAAAYYTEVVNRYPETRWAQLAQAARP